MCDNAINKASDMVSSVTSADSYEAVPSDQELAELKADLSEKTADIEVLKQKVQSLMDKDAEKDRQLEALTKVCAFPLSMKFANFRCCGHFFQ